MDGNVFFGFDDTKLGRLKGKPENLSSKFKSIKWLFATVGSLVLACFLIINEGRNYGKIKTKQISLV